MILRPMRSRKLHICLKKESKISNNRFYLRNKIIADVLIIAHASLICSAWQGVNRNTNKKKGGKVKMEGRP